MMNEISARLAANAADCAQLARVTETLTRIVCNGGYVTDARLVEQRNELRARLGLEYDAVNRRWQEWAE